MAVSLAVCHAGILVAEEGKSEVPETKTLSREKRTLGLLTVGAKAVAAGIGTAGKVAGATIATAAALKPLILLGLGKCK